MIWLNLPTEFSQEKQAFVVQSDSWLVCESSDLDTTRLPKELKTGLWDHMIQPSERAVVERLKSASRVGRRLAPTGDLPWMIASPSSE